MVRPVIVAVLFGVVAQQATKPQAIYSHTVKRIIATFTPDDEVLRINRYAPKTLKVCIQDVCRTQDQWLRGER